MELENHGEVHSVTSRYSHIHAYNTLVSVSSQ